MVERFSEASNSLRQREVSPNTAEQFRRQAAREREGWRIKQANEQERLSNTPSPSPPPREPEWRSNQEERDTHETSGSLTQFLNEPKIPPEILAEIPLEILAEIPLEILKGKKCSTILDNPPAPPEVLAEATPDRQSAESLVIDLMAPYHQGFEGMGPYDQSATPVEPRLPRETIGERLRNITEDDIESLGMIIKSLDDNILLRLKNDLEKQGSMSIALGQLGVLESFRRNTTNNPKEAGANLVLLIEQQLLSRYQRKKVLKEFASDLKRHIISTWSDMTEDRALEKFSSHFYQLAFSSTPAFSPEQKQNPEVPYRPALPDIKAEPTSIEDFIRPETMRQLGQVIRNLDKDYLAELQQSLEIKNLRLSEDVACINELQVLQDFRVDMETGAEYQTQQAETQHNLALKKAVINLVRLVRSELSGPLDAAKKNFKADLEQNLPRGITVDTLRNYQIAIEAFSLAETTSTASNKNQFDSFAMPPPIKKESDGDSRHSDQVSGLSVGAKSDTTGYTMGSDPRWQEEENQGIHVPKRLRQELKMAAYRYTKNEAVLGSLKGKINLSDFQDNIGSREAIIMPARIKAKEQTDKALQKFYKMTNNPGLLETIMNDTSCMQGTTTWLAKRLLSMKGELKLEESDSNKLSLSVDELDDIHDKLVQYLQKANSIFKGKKQKFNDNDCHSVAYVIIDKQIKQYVKNPDERERLDILDDYSDITEDQVNNANILKQYIALQKWKKVAENYDLLEAVWKKIPRAEQQDKITLVAADLWLEGQILEDTLRATDILSIEDAENIKEKLSECVKAVNGLLPSDEDHKDDKFNRDEYDIVVDQVANEELKRYMSEEDKELL